MSSGMTKLAIVLVTMVALSTTALQGAEAVTYFVGDAAAWSIPANGASMYSNWSSSYTFNVGDILVFNFVTGQHDVAEVTKDNYDSCGTASPTLLLSNGPANFTLNATETYYFICTHTGHCGAGQKVSVTVGSSSSSGPSASTPAPGTSTTTPSPPPPPGSGAASIAATSKVFLVSLAIVIGFMRM